MQVARPRQKKSPLLPTVVITAIIVVLGTLFTHLWTDNLWFGSLGYRSVFLTQLATKAGLFAFFGGVMAAVIIINVVLAYRLRPRTRRMVSSSPALDRYRAWLEGAPWLVATVPAVLLGLMAGGTATSHTSAYLAWRNAAPFGVKDPRFGLDASFFVFSYPWWRFVASFTLTVLVFGLLAAAVVHFALGALRSGQGPVKQTTRAARVHLSILVALALIVYGLERLLDRYGVEITSNTLLTGMTYTDDRARIGASLVIAVIAFICAALFMASAVLNKFFGAVAALVLMVVSGLVISLIYPAAIQAFSVKPDEPDKERPYIERHIAATRAAFDIGDITIQDYSAKTTVSEGQLKADAEAIPGIRLMDPAIIGPTFEQLQQVRGYYSFPRVLDVDRYRLDGAETDVVVAAREMDQSGVPDKNWNTIHTVYTHGHGLVMAYGNRRQAAGEPEWIVRDIPPVGKVAEHQPRIYFGEAQNEFAVVGRAAGEAPLELDTPGGGEQGGEKNNTYDGSGGVSIGGWFNRLLYAIRFADVNLLLSDRVNSASRILYDRTPQERVKAAAPWLTIDSNVFPAIVDGRIVWIVDGYTTSNSYPNSHRVTLKDAISDSQTSVSDQLAPPEQINYMRNSVKAVVDAYDGTVTLYAWDEADPILKTWQGAFPNTVHPKADISAALMAHLRYPQDLFKVQREVLRRYHMTNPQAWFNQSDLWAVPDDPVRGKDVKESPYYLSIKWPGDQQAVYSQTTVFVPRLRSNLASFMSVNADAASPDYGRIRVLKMSDSKQIDGPGQTFNAINTNEKVAERLRPFLNQGSAAAEYGNLLTLPVGGGLLYVQPIYTMRQGNGANYPALRFVVVRFGEHVGIGDTLQQALDEVFQGNAGASTGEDNQPPTTNNPAGSVDNPAAVKALNEADKAFSDAAAALRAGDLATYQKKNAEAEAAVQRALAALGR